MDCKKDAEQNGCKPMASGASNKIENWLKKNEVGGDRDFADRREKIVFDVLCTGTEKCKLNQPEYVDEAALNRLLNPVRSGVHSGGLCPPP